MSKIFKLLLPVLAGLGIAVLLLVSASLVGARTLPAPRLEVTEDDNYSVAEDQLLSVTAPGVLGNDGDGATTATLITDVSHGALSLNLDGSFEYTPALNYNGPDQFVYTSTNLTGTFQYTALIDVLSVNDAPVAVDDDYLATENQTLNVGAPGVLGNDSDIEDDSLSAVLVTGPGNGTLNLLADGSFTYTPDLDYYGEDTFTYQADDDDDLSNLATVTITVNDIPTVQSDSINTNEDTPVLIDVLDNDFDQIGGLNFDSLTIITDGVWGTSEITDDIIPLLRFTPDPNEFGQDYVEYQVCDVFGECGSNIVEIMILQVNDPPIANNDSYSVAANNILTVAPRGVLTNDTDIDTALSLLTAELDSEPSNGQVVLNANGGFTYTPDADYVGPDSFTYRANDGLLNSTTEAVVTLNVTNTLPPITEPDLYTTSEDTPLVISAPGVLGNDEDPEQFPLTAVLSPGDLLPSHGSVTLNADGSFTYTPDLDFEGTDSFQYRADDGTVLSNAEDVTITVTAVNDAPVAAADSYLLDEDTLLDVAAADGVLDNDQDVDGDTLTAELVSAPAHGSLALNLDGSFTYDPDPNYFGADSFVYRADDGSLSSSEVTVTLTIEPVNDPPQPGADSFIYNLADQNAAGNLVISASDLLANDSDVENDDLTVSGINNQPDHGTLEIESEGSFVYTPDAGYNGMDSFEYLVSDGQQSSVGRVDIRIDTLPPQVSWTSPSGITNGGVYIVAQPLGQQITLAFEADEQEGLIDTVTLRNWNTRLKQWQDLQAFAAPPYSFTFHSDLLGEFGFNDVRVFAYDDAGNLGTINVFIFRPGKIFLPNIRTP